MFGALNDPYLVLLVLFCAAVVTIGGIVTALHRVPRAKFTQLHNEHKELSERLRVLEAAEQRRFLIELNSHSPRPEITLTPGTEETEVAGAVMRGFPSTREMENTDLPVARRRRACMRVSLARSRPVRRNCAYQHQGHSDFGLDVRQEVGDPPQGTSVPIDERRITGKEIAVKPDCHA